MPTVSSAGIAPCAWCGGPLAPSDRPQAAPCAACGVATTLPRPTDAELDAAYAGWYRPRSGRFSGPGDALLRRSRGRLAGRLDALAPPGPILDVGSGDGFLLDALRARGREAVGLERDAASRADVRAAEVTEIGGAWAGVVFWHSLEHLREPRAALEHAAGLLAPGGVLVVAVPNAGSLQARAFGSRWFGRDLPRHLVHLTAAALLEAIRARGLEVTRVSHWRGGQIVFGWCHGLVGRLPGRPDLYDAIRRPEARSRPMTPARRAGTLAAAVALAPLAVAGALAEVAAGRGGTVYLEAVRGR